MAGQPKQDTEQKKQEQPVVFENMPPGEVRMFDGRNLGQWKITDFGGQGNVHVKDESIMLATGDNLTGVTWAGPVLRMNYEINLDAMRVDGDDFFCGLTFPVGAVPSAAFRASITMTPPTMKPRQKGISMTTAGITSVSASLPTRFSAGSITSNMLILKPLAKGSVSAST
jgi:hypothetical protein